MKHTPTKKIGVFSLVMMNIMAVDSLRSLPVAAQFGYALLFFYCLAAVLFFIPTALVTAELATTWPNTGGAYTWIRMAFGIRWGWLAIWLQWIYNVVWYPVILAFVIATIAYLFSPNLIQHKSFLLIVLLSIWWCVTGLSLLGLRVSTWLSRLGALVGTLLPLLFIITLACLWIQAHKPLAIQLIPANFLPNWHDFNNLAFFTTLIFGLMGLEMSAVHAGDVLNPQKNFPLALFWSAGLILLTLILGAIAIALIVPLDQLSILSGLNNAYSLFFLKFNLKVLLPFFLLLIIFGSLCSVSTWVIGPTRGLLVATLENETKNLSWFTKLNRFDAPVNLLLFQGALVSLLAALFILIPTVKEAYWLLSVMTAQLALLFYILLFLAALRLRYTAIEPRRGYQIPGGLAGMWITAGIAIVTCLATFILGFFPPSTIATHNLYKFDGILILGMLLACMPAYWVTQATKVN